MRAEKLKAWRYAWIWAPSMGCRAAASVPPNDFRIEGCVGTHPSNSPALRTFKIRQTLECESVSPPTSVSELGFVCSFLAILSGSLDRGWGWWGTTSGLGFVCSFLYDFAFDCFDLR